LLIISTISANCAPLYRPRTSEEIKALGLEIGPVPESMLKIPEFDGEDTVPVFEIELREADYRGFAFIRLYNSGMVIYQNHAGDIVKKKNIDVDSFQVLIFELNRLGYFSITNDNIEKKKWVEDQGCCLFLFLGGMPVRRNYQTDGLIMQFKLTGLIHKITLGRLMLSDSVYNIEDVHILRQCFQMLAVVLYQ